MNTRMLVFVALLVLPGCGPFDDEQSANQVGASNNTVVAANQQTLPTSRPAFSLDEVSAQDLLADSNEGWDEPISDIDSDDSLTGGRHRSFTFRRNSLDLFILPDGKVWRLRANIGFGDKCGDDAVAQKVAGDLVDAFAPGNDASSFIAGLARPGMVELDTANANFKASKACVTSISVTAKNGPTL